MAEDLPEFTLGWNIRFPNVEIPDLSVLHVLEENSPDADRLILDAVENDTLSLNERKQKLTEELSQINYCLSWMRKVALAENVYENRIHPVDRRGSLRSLPPPSSLRLTMRRGSDPSPLTFDHRFRSPTNGSLTRPVDFQCNRRSYENYTPPGTPPSSPIYDFVPPPKKKVVHSAEFKDVLTKFCDKISPDQGRVFLQSLGETCSGPVDLKSRLLNNKQVDESDLGPLFKALEDSGLSHFVVLFETFMKRESPDGEENEDIYVDLNTCNKSPTAPAPEPPPVPSSPRPNRPESFTKTLFRVCNSLTSDQALSILHHLGEKNVKKSDLETHGKIAALLMMNSHVNIANIDRLVEALKKENLHHLGEDLKNSLTKLETKFVFPQDSPRRGSLDSAKTENSSLTRGSRVRGQSPFRARGSGTSPEAGQSGGLLNFIHKNRLTRSNSHDGPLMSLNMSQQSRFIERGAASENEERDIKSPRSAVSPAICPKNVFQFGIKIIEDHEPAKRKNTEHRKSADYKDFALLRGQQFDVIGEWKLQYLVRNKKGEIGLVSKDKCEVLMGLDSILCGKDWFLDCPVRHSTLELLKESPVGTFFIRDCHSKPGDLVLSVKLVENSVKYSITINKASYEIKDKSFSSLDELITYYRQNCIHRVDGGCQVFLTKPLQHEQCN